MSNYTFSPSVSSPIIYAVSSSSSTDTLIHYTSPIRVLNSLKLHFSSAASLFPILNILNNSTLSMTIAATLCSEREAIASLLAYDLQFDPYSDHGPYTHTITTQRLNAAGQPLTLIIKTHNRATMLGFIPTSITTVLSSVLCYRKKPSLIKMLKDFNSLNVFEFLQQKYNENPINGFVHLSRIICLCRITEVINNIYFIPFNDTYTYKLFSEFKDKLSALWKQMNGDSYKLLLYPLFNFFDVFESNNCLSYIDSMHQIIQ